MSGHTRYGNRSAPAKFDGRLKKDSNAGTRSEWKPKVPVKIDGSSDSATCSQTDGIPVTSLSVVEDVKNLNLTPDDDGGGGGGWTEVKAKRSGNKSKNDDGHDNVKFNHPVFDICPKRVGSAVKLKTPIHLLNKERRNQSKRSMKGQNIISLGPGMVLLKGYISFADQISIVKTCRELGISHGGFYQPGYSGGTKMHLRMMCLGQNWDPESRAYTELRPFDNSKPPEIPKMFYDMVIKAIADSNKFIEETIGGSNREVIPSMSPDICIVNFYTKNGRLGLHQDKDESAASLRKGLPVVSYSIGDSAEFLYGETRSIDEAQKVTLDSGDVLIFGGKSRSVFHGVTNILPDTAPKSLMEATDMQPGRLNLTFRKY